MTSTGRWKWPPGARPLCAARRPRHPRRPVLRGRDPGRGGLSLRRPCRASCCLDRRDNVRLLRIECRDPTATSGMPAQAALICGMRSPSETTSTRRRRACKWLRDCYICRMTEIAARELRNRTADVLRRVQGGERVIITSRGRPVAELTPLRAVRRGPIARTELARRLARTQADPGLRRDLAVLAGDTTDDLGPIR
jgi:prevent-host-death family protein